MDPTFWSGRRVLITGHTGFKGAWLACWLHRLGAAVTGFAQAPETEPNLWSLLGLNGVCSIIGDLNDRTALADALNEARPEVIFHLAAQSLVRRSYREPVETFATNVLGTVALLDQVRQTPGVRAVVVATSDKAYENVDQIWGYRETDPMGGHDPYSASKGAAEIATAAMRRSYFQPYAKDGHPARIGAVRAGNVIGGGDWAEDRLVPDIVRACLGPEGTVTIRSPGAIRPWQHVLEPLRGYIMAAERLCSDSEPQAADPSWNFGPDRSDERPVLGVAEALVAAIGKGAIHVDPAAATVHEATLLTLDATKARAELGWKPALGFDDCIAMTAGWYGEWASGANVAELCARQLDQYQRLCEECA